ncbi:DUF1761 domain-containing protein [Marinibacterium sp. SX1]|mgnify:CR=1 FL=1|uniref:DUF1761 domain-containing protein n=1 Tax=Marinibacterium sp. SX1 TaxID=3388424 RepID=UPI003D16F6F8
MEILSVIVAALASYGFGAAWYMILSRRWIEASGVAVDPTTGRPRNASDPLPYITAFVGSLMVAGMMRHVFAGAGLVTTGEGILAGLGIGLFLVTPWIATFYGFANRPRALTLIDGGYATGGCGMIGLVLTLF